MRRRTPDVTRALRDIGLYCLVYGQPGEERRLRAEAEALRAARERIDREIAALEAETPDRRKP